jgi:hypothetical protein
MDEMEKFMREWCLLCAIHSCPALFLALMTLHGKAHLVTWAFLMNNPLILDPETHEPICLAYISAPFVSSQPQTQEAQCQNF